MDRAAFLDRDGVINELVYWPELGLLDSPLNPKQFDLLLDVPEAIGILNNIGLKVIIVSNQPAIAKGKMTMSLFEKMSRKMRWELLKHAAHVDAEYYCFHHPQAKLPEYRANCNCRKPKPGLMLQAARDFNLELSECYMIGDGLTDIKAGKAVGCTTFLIGNHKCDLCRLMEENGVKPDYIVPNLLYASKIVEREVNEKWRYSLTQQV